MKSQGQIKIWGRLIDLTGHDQQVLPRQSDVALVSNIKERILHPHPALIGSIRPFTNKGPADDISARPLLLTGVT